MKVRNKRGFPHAITLQGSKNSLSSTAAKEEDNRKWREEIKKKKSNIQIRAFSSSIGELGLFGLLRSQ
jgi:hypothetical protein